MSFIVAEFPLNSDCHRGVKSPDLSGRLPQIFENSEISCNCVRLPPGVKISRICEILPRLDCLPLISCPSARKYIDFNMARNHRQGTSLTAMFEISRCLFIRMAVVM